jgi:hypothetical protein
VRTLIAPPLWLPRIDQPSASDPARNHSMEALRQLPADMNPLNLFEHYDRPLDEQVRRILMGERSVAGAQRKARAVDQRRATACSSRRLPWPHSADAMFTQPPLFVAATFSTGDKKISESSKPKPRWRQS